METIKKSSGKNISMCVIFLFLEILFCFLDNHSALFIADYYMLLVAFIGAMLLKSCGKIYINSLCLSLVIIVISSLLFFPIVDRGTFFSYLIWLIVMMLSLEYKFSDNELTLLMWGFILGSLIMSTLLIVQQHQYKYEGSFRYTIQILGNEEVDPNYLAAYIYIGLIFLIRQFLNGVVKMKILLLLIGLIEAFAIFMTGSRAVYVAFVFVFMGILFNKSKTKSRASKFLVIVAIVILVVFSVSNLPEDILKRFDIDMLMDESNSLRLEHWSAAGLAFLKNPLIGYGASHTMTILSTYANHTSDAHNTILTLFLHFGLIGVVPILNILLGIYKRFVRQRDTMMVWYYIGFIFINMIIANHLGISFWVPILIFYQLSRKSEVSIA